MLQGSPLRLEARIVASRMSVAVSRFHWPKPAEFEWRGSGCTVSLGLPPDVRLEVLSDACREQRFHNFGPLIFRPRDRIYQFRGVGGPRRVISCNFDPDWFREVTGLSDDWDNDRVQRCLDIRHPHLRPTMVRLAQEAIAPGFASSALVDSLGHSLVVEMARYFGNERRAAHRGGGLAPWQLKRIRERIDASGEPAPSPAELAALCGISAGYLRQAFKAATGQTLYQTIAGNRSRRAQALLADTPMTLKEIAHRLGYSDASSFTVAFRRAVGTTPSLYRRQFR